MVTLTDSIIEIKETLGKGRGVFASQDFFPCEVIERVPVLVIPQEQYPSLENTIFFHYLFGWKENDFALALGYGSLYNHSFRPNAIYRKREEEGMLEFIALHPILAGEEILINYNGEPSSEDPIWFRVVQ
ncbi:MAG: SET domain-containing protein [Chlamydiota bacterium]